jgi:hypothetical protein
MSIKWINIFILVVLLCVGCAEETTEILTVQNDGSVEIDSVNYSIEVGTISGEVTEDGGRVVFTVVLGTSPNSDVVIRLFSNDTTEGTISPSTLTFTSANWNAPQKVIVTGVDDTVQDGNITFSIVFSSVTSSDPGYDKMSVPAVPVKNIDNDTAGITVSAISGNTSESGNQATFSVVLNSAPRNDVTIGLSSSDTSEGTISPSTLTFTSANWNAPQTVNVTGVDDPVQDGDVTFSIVFSSVASSDGGYDKMSVPAVPVINIDNDTAGITVSAISGNTSESGNQATFSVVLNSAPSNDVTIGLSSSDTSEGTNSPLTLTFTSANWNAPQTVIVTGVDDASQDGDIPFSIVFSSVASSDGGYDQMSISPVSVTNIDDDTAGITVSAISGNTSESGNQATFSVVLNSAPSNDVTIGLSSSDTSEGTISPSTLTFTSANWNAPQTVIVTGVDDASQDGDIPFSIVFSSVASSDGGYDQMSVSPVSVTNIDDDTAGITVSAISGNTSESGNQATFSVVLNSAPSNDVTIGLSSSDTTEGTITTSQLLFTTLNWNAPQTITVTGADDLIVDGSQSYSIILATASSGDTDYNGIDPTDVSVVNTDDDSAIGFSINIISDTTSEEGSNSTFTIVLTAAPTADVTINLTSSDTSEGTVSPSSVTFTTVNWAAPQTVTVTGVDDALEDGNQQYSIVTSAAISSDSNYNGLDPANAALTNLDNDSQGVTIMVSESNVSEYGSSIDFTVILRSPPSNDVTMTLTSDNTSEGTISPGTMVFTGLNWSSPVTATVTGVDDALEDGNQIFHISFSSSSSDSYYDNLPIPNETFTNIDNDTVGVSVSEISGNTTETGEIATYSVVLNSAPVNDVTITLSSNDTSEGTVSPSSLTFTSNDWSSPQTVTVTGVDDAIADGQQVYKIIASTTSSSDSSYNGLEVDDLTVFNLDDDSSGITVFPNAGLSTTESEDQVSFSIVLNSTPSSDVTINLASDDTTEGTVSPDSVTFTPINWSSPQAIIATGVDDAIADGNVVYSIITAATSSSDSNYNGLNPEDVLISNWDDETPGFTVLPLTELTTTEAGGQDTFTINLNSMPAYDVVIGLTSSDTNEVIVNPASMTFTSLNWAAPQIATVTGVDEALEDGNAAILIVVGTPTTSDTNYALLNPKDVDVINVDDDRAGITIDPIASGGNTLSTTEDVGEDTFTIVLNNQPTDDVTVPLSSNDTGEGTVSPASVTFTSANWNNAQTVTVTGVDDALEDGGQTYKIIISSSTSSDAGYNGINPSDQTVINQDNDLPGIVIIPDPSKSSLSSITEIGGQDTFTVVLRTQPTDDVNFTLQSKDTSEGVVSPTSLTFTNANWDAPQTVTVTGVDDAIIDGDQVFKIDLSRASSNDPDYDRMNPLDVKVQCIDNE